MRHARTFTATVYIGLKVRATGYVHDIDVIRQACQQYVDEVGLCVTVTPTEFVYTDGGEPGAAIGLINYPRFPASRRTIRRHAMEIARRAMVAAGQLRVSVVLPWRTVMLSAACDRCDGSGTVFGWSEGAMLAAGGHDWGDPCGACRGTGKGDG